MLTWGWIIQITIISIILIFLIHHLITFFKSVLTVPKIKDLVNTPNHKYKNIYDIISNNASNTNITNKTNNIDNGVITYNLEDIIPNSKNSINNNNNNTETNMKLELKNFIKKQLNNDINIVQNSSTSISSLYSII